MSLDFHLEADVGGPERVVVFNTNITHNLSVMWRVAGVYRALYESQGETAGSIVRALRSGIDAMKADRPRFERHNAPNGWGTYEHALPWLEEVLDACERMPRALIRVSR